MNRNILIAAALLGIVAAQPAHAQQSEEERIDFAIAEAKKVGKATTITKGKMHLRRASNCLFGRDSGYFIVGAGGPCTSRINLTTTATPMEKRDNITNAANMLLAATGNPLQQAQDYAEDAIALLEEAKELGEETEEETEAE